MSIESVKARAIVQLLAAGNKPSLFPLDSIFPFFWKMCQITAPGVLLFLCTPLLSPCPATFPSLPLLPRKDHPQVPESTSLLLLLSFPICFSNTNNSLCAGPSSGVHVSISF
ncbi:unnamed protein product [Rangifer tarandus platyrhynchus]|uniref:Uncharacterized protein n=2 Tax=Rangifer tarandus platyrhynchus TaxID=3082113 RepID=A0ABN8YY58_RANTA|nr:unnamed protein product [Rangifer tarandus platyrhynchus]